MNTDMNTVRLLGAAQVMVFVSILISGGFFSSALGSDSISDILVNISKNPNRVRISNLIALVQSLAMISMGVLYYVVFYKKHKIIALMALVCFLVAAITYTVGKIGANALIPLNQKFVEAGAPEASYFQTLGDFLYNSVDKRGYELYSLFTSFGFLLTSYLLFITRSVPRAISICGLAALSLSLIPAVLTLYDREFLPGARIHSHSSNVSLMKLIMGKLDESIFPFGKRISTLDKVLLQSLFAGIGSPIIFSKYGNWIPEHGFSLGTTSFSTSSVFKFYFAQNFAATGPAIAPPAINTSYSFI